jgi:hypothetical protein
MDLLKEYGVTNSAINWNDKKEQEKITSLAGPEQARSSIWFKADKSLFGKSGLNPLAKVVHADILSLYSSI